MKDKQANARTGHKPSALVLHLVSYPEWETWNFIILTAEKISNLV
jgi:hypothetical protein